MWSRELQVLALLVLNQGAMAQESSSSSSGSSSMMSSISTVDSSTSSSVFSTDVPTIDPSPSASSSADSVVPTGLPTSPTGLSNSATSSSSGFSSISPNPFTSTRFTDPPRPSLTSLSTSSITNAGSSVTTAGPETIGLETIQFLSVTAVNVAKRAIADVTVAAGSAICAIPSARVEGVPCYPCAVGYPAPQQSLYVYTTSVYGAAPDPTPIFSYNFCRGCQATVVTQAVPGYVPGSRNYGTCLQIPGPDPTPLTTAPPAPSGLTTTTLVTATIIYQIEIISICLTNNIAVTILEESTACETYNTCVTIPESLCDTFVSTQDDGVVTTCTTPADTWTQILTVQSTTTVSAITVTTVTPGAAIAPAGYTPVATSSADAAGLPAPAASAAEAATSAADAQGASPAAPTTTTAYVQSGAGRAVVSLVTVCVSLLAYLLV